jgi:hypothetical protein
MVPSMPFYNLVGVGIDCFATKPADTVKTLADMYVPYQVGGRSCML